MKTTKKDFEVFKKECEKWIEFFGLKDWRVEYEHRPLDNARADVEADIMNKWAVITMSKDQEDKKHIKESAFHEVCHLLHYGFDFIKKDKGHSEDVWDRECESFVRRMENSVFKKFYKK